MRLILAQGQQECTNLAIIPEGLQGLHKRPLKNESYPSEFTSENKSDRRLGPVKGIKGRMGERETGHLKDIWKISVKSDRDLPQKKRSGLCCLKTLLPHHFK